MDIKLVREHISEKPQKVTIKKLEEMLEAQKMDIFYCDKENSHKDMMALMTADLYGNLRDRNKKYPFFELLAFVLIFLV